MSDSASGGYLVVDVGTATVAAAMVTPGYAPTIVEFDGRPVMPAGASLTAEATLTGYEGLQQGYHTPEWYCDDLLTHLDTDTVRIGTGEMRTSDLLTQVIGRVRSDVRNSVHSAPNTELILTHPLFWSTDRVSRLRHAGTRLGASVTMVPEPYAAAARVDIRHGGTVVLFDAGSSALKVHAMRWVNGQYEILNSVEIPEAGGTALDQAVLRYAADSLASSNTESAWDAFAGQLGMDGYESHRMAIHARTVEHARVLAMQGSAATLELPGFTKPARITDNEVRLAIQDVISKAVPKIEQALNGIPHTAAYLYGGAARDANIQWLVQHALGGHVTVLEEPDTVCASGAALHWTDADGAHTGSLRRHRITSSNARQGQGKATPAAAAAPSAAASGAPSLPSQELSAPPKSKKRRNAGIAAASALVVLGGAVGAGAMLWPADPTGPEARAEAQRLVTSMMPPESAFSERDLSPVVEEGTRIREGFDPSLSSVSCDAYSTAPTDAERQGRLARSSVSFNRPGSVVEGISVSAVAFTEEAAPNVLSQARTVIGQCVSDPKSGFDEVEFRAPSASDTRERVAFDVVGPAQTEGGPPSLATCVLTRQNEIVVRSCGTSTKSHEASNSYAEMGSRTVLDAAPN